MSWLTLYPSDHRGISNLGPGHEGFDTGVMTYCTTVILLWNPDPSSGNFLNGRGLHCNGGFLAVLPAASSAGAMALFKGVPDQASARAILIGPLFDPTSPFETTSERSQAIAAIGTIFQARLPHVPRETWGLSNARVDRKGLVRDLSSLAARPAWGADAKGKRKPPSGSCTIL